MAATQRGDPMAGYAASSLSGHVVYFLFLGSLLLYCHYLSLYFLYSKGPNLYRLCSVDSLSHSHLEDSPHFVPTAWNVSSVVYSDINVNSLFWTLFKPPIPCCAFLMTFTCFFFFEFVSHGTLVQCVIWTPQCVFDM